MIEDALVSKLEIMYTLAEMMKAVPHLRQNSDPVIETLAAILGMVSDAKALAVQCKDCKYWWPGCGKGLRDANEDGYCSYGKKREEKTDEIQEIE